MRGNSEEITPKNDATLGLIFRLNALWAEADIHAKNGDYNLWNSILDRIYCNLAYREEMVVVKDPKTEKIIGMKLSVKDDQEYKFLTSRISEYKLKCIRATGMYKKGISNKMYMKSLWYRSVRLKDIWLRKLMNSLNLYIKETVSDPGGVMGW